MAIQNIEMATPIQAPSPTAFLTELAFGMKMTQALYVVAKLRLSGVAETTGTAIRL